MPGLKPRSDWGNNQIIGLHLAVPSFKILFIYVTWEAAFRKLPIFLKQPHDLCCNKKMLIIQSKIYLAPVQIRLPRLKRMHWTKTGSCFLMGRKSDHFSHPVFLRPSFTPLSLFSLGSLSVLPSFCLLSVDTRLCFCWFRMWNNVNQEKISGVLPFLCTFVNQRKICTLFLWGWGVGGGVGEESS